MDAEGNDVLSGFICPFCFENLGDVRLLQVGHFHDTLKFQVHVEQFHAESTGGEVFEQFKGECPSYACHSVREYTLIETAGFLGKAKARIAKEMAPSLNVVLDLPRLTDSAASTSIARPSSLAASAPAPTLSQPQKTPAQLPRWTPPPSTIGTCFHCSSVRSIVGMYYSFDKSRDSQDL